MKATIQAMKKQRLEDRKKLAQLSTHVADLTNRTRNHQTNRKWLADNGKRIDEVATSSKGKTKWSWKGEKAGGRRKKGKGRIQKRKEQE